jgi:SAM-dependent methyltransferase
MTGDFDLDFDLDRAVPWGRNRAEYLAFFDLLDLAPGARILDCGAGPSSFNAEMTALGFKVVSADPLYGYSKPAIAGRIAGARSAIMTGVKAASGRFVWDDYGSPEGLERTRLSAMKFFLEDYEEGLAEGRYRDARLPELPFDDGAFDLALSSHFLLLYSAQLDLAFHQAAVLEMLRVAAEARIFPLLDMAGTRSRHLEPLIEALTASGYACEIRAVAYEFQKGGNEMLRIARN